MNSKMRAAIVTVGVMLFGVAGTARADSTMMEANVPVAFVVNGRTLPAGKYMVERESSSMVLIRGEKDNHSAVFVATLPTSGVNPAGYQPALVLNQHEGRYQLASIWESAHDGWNVTNR